MSMIGVNGYNLINAQVGLKSNPIVVKHSYSSQNVLKSDVVSFQKQFSPKERNMEDVSVIELMAHNYLDLRRKDWGASIVYDGLSPQNISRKLKENFLDVMTKIGIGVHADANLVEWKTFLNSDYKAASCKGVNKARSDRLKDYSFVDTININKENLPEDVALCIDKLKNNSAYQFLAMLIAFNEVKDSNRHIPLPFDIKVLAKTFAQVDAKREIMSIDRLSSLYHSNLIENALLKNTGKIIHIDEKTDVANMKHCWVCVPGRGEEDELQEKLINLVEIFSNKNWCTHSREDKAKAQVETGDFFVYLKRDEDNNWIPMTAVSTDNRYKKHNKLGVIELQGVKNNYILSDEDYKRIKILMQKSGQSLKFKHKDINGSAPSACIQMAVMKYLEKGGSLANAISDIRKANEQKDELSVKRTKYKERIKLLKPSSNLSMNFSQRLDIEDEIRQYDSRIKNIDQILLNTKGKNKILYNNLLSAIGANPVSYNYSVIDAIDVISKILKINVNVDTVVQMDIPELVSKTYPTINSTQVTIPVQVTKDAFNKKLFLNQVVSGLSKMDLNEVSTSESLLSLGTYNPVVDIDYMLKEKRPYASVPLMYFGIDEDELLSNVKNIDVFYMKNSGIKKFPKKLSKVNELYCSDVQYRKFKKEINLLKSRNPQMKLFISVTK